LIITKNSIQLGLDKGETKQEKGKERNLLLDELGEEALGLDSRDIATVVPPHQNAPLYI